MILGLHPANEKRRYFVTPSLIGWCKPNISPDIVWCYCNIHLSYHSHWLYNNWCHYHLCITHSICTRYQAAIQYSCFKGLSFYHFYVHVTMLQQWYSYIMIPWGCRGAVCTQMSLSVLQASHLSSFLFMVSRNRQMGVHILPLWFPVMAAYNGNGMLTTHAIGILMD